MSGLVHVTDRYEILGTLGEGGMGMVYRARDAVVEREVALKTIRDTPSRMALDLFRKECSVLAAMSHPNIVEIFDVGDFEEGGNQKPYFVMPLLRGETLAQLIRNDSQQLTLERSVEIMLQTCRGLHAAHERGLVHRDLKPNNIFVLPDDSVKIIDFGVAHMADSSATMTVKGGTLLYMAPEQIEMKPATASCDIFALGVVFYETLTGRRPFGFTTEQEIVDAILHYIPPPVSEVNPSVPVIYSRIIHKALAKQPWNRFSTVKEMAETIQKARRNQPIEMFDPARLAPRVQRAIKAFEQGNLAFAAEILGELEAAGEVDSTLSDLRRRLDATTRQRTLSQLLDSARTCIEEEEFLLALQKIQEVLQLDPQNATAMGMRNTIEVRRNEHKVEEWLQLARRHMENNAFSHARDALNNILKISPSDATAYQLLTDVDRREDQHVKARQDKDNLYKGALSAWKNGDVSSALSKLERLVELDHSVPDGGDRSISYQNFYNEVRSEQDLMKSNYQEARANLADGNYSAALEICQQYLAKYPGHALFQALKFDVEEKERQAISSRIAEVDKQVDAEPDLDRRASLLRAAVEQYPGEPHFERALRLARDKRDLVNGIVAKARAYEEQGQYSEALGQLEILLTIHKEFPGLEFEIERLQKRREQQTLSEAKARWVDQIDRHLESADYARAMELIAKAMEEFPGDPEMQALENMARQSQSRAAEAQEWWRTGQSLIAANQYEDGIEALRQAWKLDGHNPAVRNALLQTLTQRARTLLDQDWRTARRIIDEALEVDSTFGPARSVHTLTLDREREDNVTAITAECRRLQSAGEFQAALSLVDHGLSKYPKELRLSQLQSTLRKAVPAQPERALTAGASAPVPAPAASGPEPTPEARAGAAAVTEQLNPVAPEIAAQQPAASMSATELLGAYQGPAGAASAVAVPPGPQPVTTPRQGASPAAPPKAAKPPKPPKAPKPPQSAPGAPGKLPPALQRVPIWAWPAGGAVVLAMAAFAAAGFWPVSVDFKTEPPGATVKIEGVVRGQSDMRLKLRPGAYRVDFSKDGYFNSAQFLNVRRLSGGVLSVNLQPVPPDNTAAAPVPNFPGVHVITDLPAGEVVVDGGAPVPLQDGAFSLDRLTEGTHTFLVRSGAAEASVSLRAAPNAAAEVDGAVTAKDLQAVVVTAMGDHARVYSATPVAVSVDGHQAGNTGTAGVDLTGLTEGDHEVILQAGTDVRKVQLHSSPAATVSVFVASDRNVGSLLVATNEDGAHVVVDGKEQKSLTRGGQLHVGNLTVSNHVIRVYKEGFQEEPPVQVAIRKHEEFRQRFQLRPLPTQASLAIHGAIAGAEVRVDQNLVGTVQPDGSFTFDSMTPGAHEIELRAHHYKIKVIHATFRAGSQEQLAAADVAMERSTGFLQLAFTPANATVTYVRSGEELQRATAGKFELDEGTYTFSASAPGFADQSHVVQVAAGKTETLSIHLAPQRVAPTVLNMDAWAKAGWERQGEWYLHKGGDFVIFPAVPSSGTFAFTALRHTHLLGNNRIEWVVNYIDSRNYMLLELDKKNLIVTEVKNDVRRELRKIPVPVPPERDKLQYTIRVDISGERIDQFLQKGNAWVPLSSLTGKDLSRGGFGFYLPGGDELLVGGFSFTKKP
jgi:serine/threonine protein kinase/cytochrome c-type biogenesis protein CcmH/NrfG